MPDLTLEEAVEQCNKARQEYLNAVAARAVHLYHFYLISKGKLNVEEVIHNGKGK